MISSHICVSAGPSDASARRVNDIVVAWMVQVAHPKSIVPSVAVHSTFTARSDFAAALFWSVWHEATRIICSDRHLQATRVLVLTTFDLDEYVYGALRAGASGFVLKDTRPRDLLRAIEIVAAGDALLSPSITRRLIAEFAARPDPDEPSAALTELTEREREITRLVADGLTNNEIAGRLVISPLTAKTHVSNILRKLDCRDRAALVALAYESGLVSPGGTC